MNETNFIINQVVSNTPFALKPTDGFCRSVIKSIVSPIILIPVSGASVVWYSGRVVVDLTKLVGDVLCGRSRLSTSATDLENHFIDCVNGGKIFLISVGTLSYEALAVSVFISGFPILKAVFCFSVTTIVSVAFGYGALSASTDFTASTVSPVSLNLSNPSRPEINIVFDVLNQNPGLILKELSGNGFYALNATNFRINYLNLDGSRQIGVDHGGLTRDFFTRIFKSFAHKAEETKGFSVEDQGSILLTKNAAANQEFEVFGQLLGLAYKNKVTIGNAFSISFYSMLKAFKFSTYNRSFNYLTNDELIRLYVKRSKLDPNVNKLYQYSKKTLDQLKSEGKFKEEMLYYAFPDGAFPPGLSSLENIENNFSQFQRAIKKNLLENAKNDPTLQAAFYIGRGLAKSLNNDKWNEITSCKSYSLCERFQGVLSRDDLLSKIDSSYDSILPNVRRWVREADLKMLEDFVFASTGARALREDDKILLNQSYSSSSPFGFHTCSKSVDVPGGLSYADFKEAMEVAVQAALAQGFLFA